MTVDTGQIVAAFRDVASTKSLTPDEVNELLRDGIRAGLARIYGPNVQAEIKIDDTAGGFDIVVLRRVVEEVHAAGGRADQCKNRRDRSCELLSGRPRGRHAAQGDRLSHRWAAGWRGAAERPGRRAACRRAPVYRYLAGQPQGPVHDRGRRPRELSPPGIGQGWAVRLLRSVSPHSRPIVDA